MANRAVYCAKVKKRANFIFYANGKRGAVRKNLSRNNTVGKKLSKRNLV